MCKSVCELIVGVVIAVLTLWQLMSGMLVVWASWVVAVLAVLLAIHSFTCKSCFSGRSMKK